MELLKHGSDEPVCPNCGHNNAMLFRRLNDNGSKVYKCRDCGHVEMDPTFKDLTK